MRQHSFNSFLLLGTGPPLPPGFSAPAASSSSNSSSKTKQQPSQDTGDSDSDSDDDDDSGDDGQEDEVKHSVFPYRPNIIFVSGDKNYLSMYNVFTGTCI